MPGFLKQLTRKAPTIIAATVATAAVTKLTSTKLPDIDTNILTAIASGSAKGTCKPKSSVSTEPNHKLRR